MGILDFKAADSPSVSDAFKKAMDRASSSMVRSGKDISNMSPLFRDAMAISEHPATGYTQKDLDLLKSYRAEMMEVSSKLANQHKIAADIHNVLSSTKSVSDATGASQYKVLEQMRTMYQTQKGLTEGQNAYYRYMAHITNEAQKQVNLERTRGGFFGMANRGYLAQQQEYTKSFMGNIMSLKRPGHSIFNIADRVADFGNVLSTMGEVTGGIKGKVLQWGGKILQNVSSTIQTVDSAIGQLRHVGQYFQTAMGGVQGFMQANLNAMSKMVGSALPGAGAALQQMGNAVIQAVIVLVEDAIAASHIEQASIAQTDEGKTSVSMWAKQQIGFIGRDEAKQWAAAFSNIGVTGLGEKSLNELLAVKYGQLLSVQETTNYLNQFMVLSGTSSNAAKQLSSAFAQMKAAAKGTEIPVKSMVKWIADAGVQSRLLNVDYKVLSNTMGYLASREKQLARVGVSVRESGGKILGELTGKHFSEELHAFLGVKAGLSSDPIKAIVRSMLGKEAAMSLKATAGGGLTIDEKAAKSDTMATRIGAMLQMMNEATASITDNEQKFYYRRKMAMDVFGFSEEAANTLALADASDVQKFMKENPDVVNETRGTREVVAKLLTVAQRSEILQRMMAHATIATAAIAVLVPKVLVEGFTGKLGKTGNKEIDDFIQQQSQVVITNMNNAFKNTKDLTEGPLAPLYRAFELLGFGKTVQVQAKAAGGPFSAGDLLQVGEHGPELIQVGFGGQVIPDHHTKSIVSGGNSGNVIVHINGIRDKEHLISEVVAAIRSNYYV